MILITNESDLLPDKKDKNVIDIELDDIVHFKTHHIYRSSLIVFVDDERIKILKNRYLLMGNGIYPKDYLETLLSIYLDYEKENV